MDMKKIVITFVALFALFDLYADTYTDPNTGCTWTYMISDGSAELIPQDYGGVESVLVEGEPYWGEVWVEGEYVELKSDSYSKLYGAYYYIDHWLGGSRWIEHHYWPESTHRVWVPGYWTKGWIPTTAWKDVYRSPVPCLSYGQGAVVIPSTLGGCPVTRIGSKAFCGCDGITSLVIPNSVTDIDDDAFDCPHISAVTVSAYILDKYELADIFSVAREKLESVTITDGCGVTSVRAGAFSGYAALASVVIGRGVTSIGYEAFMDCGSLTSVTISDGVTSIEESVFEGCSGLASVTIPDSVTSIGYDAFSGCCGLTSVVLGNGVESIGAGAFIGCSSLASVMIPDGVRSIGNGAFEGCSGLMSITIPDRVTYIGRQAFCDCSGLASVTIGDGVTSIEDRAFEGCSGLVSVTIGKSVASIGNEAFSGCGSLMGLTIPEGVTSIGESAFKGCAGLISVAIPDSVVSIGSGAFDGCDGLFDLTTIPGVRLADGWAVGSTDSLFGYLNLAGVRGIGGGAFSDCSSLSGLSIPANVPIGNDAFSGCINIKDVVVPGWSCGIPFSSVTNLGISCGVTSIRDHAFSGCRGITIVTIPNGVTSVGRYAFSDCRGLTSVTMPDSVTSIGKGAFSGCVELTSVTIPDSVTSIGSEAFSGCVRLTAVTIPPSVTSIEESVFLGCSVLTSVTMPDSVTSIGDSAFSGCGELASVTIPDSVTSIGERAFYGCGGLSSVMIPDRVTYIGKQAFCKCSGLTSVTIGDGVTSIEVCAFEGCSVLASVTIGDGVMSIGDGAFSGCFGLMEFCVSPHNEVFSSSNKLLLSKDGKTLIKGVNGDVTIPGSVTNIGNSAFKDSRSLVSVTIPDGMMSIGDSAFSGCIELASVMIPDGVTSIGESAFFGCRGITNITMSNSVVSIGAAAFADCSSLRSVTMPGIDVDPSVFSGCWLGMIEIIRPPCKVNFDAMGGVVLGESASIVVPSGETIEMPFVMQDGYIFDGWWTAATGESNRFAVSSLCKVTSDITYFAHWTENYTVTNVRGMQRKNTNLVDIYYDLNASDGEVYHVQVEIVGRTNEVRAASFTGDIGDGIMSGKDLHIVWSARADWPDKKGDVRVVVTASRIGSHDKVQLWADGPHWATMNIGADGPWESGYYFWWGDTVGYKLENDRWVASNGSGSICFCYDDNYHSDWRSRQTCYKTEAELQREGWITADNILAPEHDAAQTHWGGHWRMPTDHELEGLLNNCDWTPMTMNGVCGHVVRGRGDYVSNFIFLPCTSFGLGSGIAINHGAESVYRSSRPAMRDGYGPCAMALYFSYFDWQGWYMRLWDRDVGLPVRPVQ